MKTEFSLRPGVYALVAFAAPLALTTVLVWQDAPQISGFVLRNLLFSIACLVFSVALSVAIFRVAKIHLCSKQGSGLLLLIPLVGFLIFLAGSYVGSFGLHWAALPVVYFGVAAYLAGRRATELLLPSITAFGLIPAPSYFGAGALSALSYAMFAVAGVSTLVAVRFRAEKDVE